MSSFDEAEKARKALVRELVGNPAFGGAGIVSVDNGYGIKVYLDAEATDAIEVPKEYRGVPLVRARKRRFLAG